MSVEIAGYGASPQPGCHPGLSALRSDNSAFHQTFDQEAYTDRGIRTPASMSRRLAQPGAVEPFDESQEYALPRVPRQKPIDQPTATSDDLAGYLDHGRTEGLELHP